MEPKEQHVAGDPDLRLTGAHAASLVDPVARAAAFAALIPALEALARQAGTDPRLSAQARRVLCAIARTRPPDTLSPSGLAVRASTPKTCVPSALVELHTHGCLARVAAIAAHLAAALPAIDTIPDDALGATVRIGNGCAGLMTYSRPYVKQWVITGPPLASG